MSSDEIYFSELNVAYWSRNNNFIVYNISIINDSQWVYILLLKGPSEWALTNHNIISGFILNQTDLKTCLNVEFMFLISTSLSHLIFIYFIHTCILWFSDQSENMPSLNKYSISFPESLDGSGWMVSFPYAPALGTFVTACEHFLLNYSPSNGRSKPFHISLTSGR